MRRGCGRRDARFGTARGRRPSALAFANPASRLPHPGRAPRAGGFTLFEMLAVILLVGIAAAAVSVSVTQGLRGARVAAASGELAAALRATRAEIPKAAPPRVLEEFNRFCRGGAGRRSFELCFETGVFEVILPELAATYGSEGPERRALFALLDAIDARWARGLDVGTAEIFAALIFAAVAPKLGWSLDGTPADPAHAKQNDRFAVVLRITEAKPEYGHIMVADYLPAGFEIDNPHLVSSGDTGTLDWIEDGQEPVNTEFRDDRFTAAIDRSGKDKAVFTVAYVVRAVSPGKYVLPQAYVEDMYNPSRYGRTGTGTVEVRSAK